MTTLITAAKETSLGDVYQQFITTDVNFHLMLAFSGMSIVVIIEKCISFRCLIRLLGVSSHWDN